MRTNLKLRLAAGGLMVGLMAFAAIAAPLIAPADPYVQNLMMRMTPPVWDAGGSWANLLGTDTYGRDLLSRLIYGAQLSMLIALSATAIALCLGSLLGVTAGYFGGRVENVIMRFAEAYQAIPDILLAIVLVSFFGGGLAMLIVVLGLSGWDTYTRLTFNLTRSFRERPYVEAAKASGGGSAYIMFRHILPQLLPVLTVTATLQVAQVVLQETALSFLGLGLPSPAATWGNILAEGSQRLLVAPWITNLSGMAVVLLVLGITLLGGALRDIVDPRSARR